MRNVTPIDARTVMLRKFFQMVFMGNNKKSLHVYTAMILGASNEKITDDCNTFISRFDLLKQFSMRFEFAVSGNDYNDVAKINHKDITNGKYGFLEEIGCIRRVWGPKCKIILDDQMELNDRLERIYANCKGEKVKPAEKSMGNSLSQLTNQKLLWTEQEKTNKKLNQLMTSLAIQGICQENVPCLIDPDIREDGAYRSAYSISRPADQLLFPGIELVNWIHTTIDFKHEIDDTNLNYILKKDSKDGEDTQYYAPDFTWYFSPAVKSFIDNRNAMVEIKRLSHNIESCTCPYRAKNCMPHFHDKYQNSIDPVPNKMTVNFHHWDKKEQINSRQKYRLAAKDILTSPEIFACLAEIQIYLDTADEHNRGNRQFILGVFLSFALAFGIDSSRLRGVADFFPFHNQINADFLWIAFLILFTMTIMSKPPKLTKKSRIMLVVRKVLILLAISWVVLVFALFCSPFFINNIMNAYLKDIPLDFHIIVQISCAAIIILHVAYLIFSRVNRYDSILKDLFGKDIL